jgi:hypothetical protein
VNGEGGWKHGKVNIYWERKESRRFNQWRSLSVINLPSLYQFVSSLANEKCKVISCARANMQCSERCDLRRKGRHVKKRVGCGFPSEGGKKSREDEH